jgi:uncharacterized protein YukE
VLRCVTRYAQRPNPADCRRDHPLLNDGHAEDIYARHSLADARIESAQAGWTGLSAVAMSAKAAQWQTTTTEFFDRLLGHAQALTASGLDYQQTEDDNTQALGRVGLDAAGGLA